VTNGLEQSGVPAASSERRLRYRRKSASLAYVEMGEDNGGIVLNVSEGGLAVHSVVAVTDEHLSRLRFQLSPACDWVNASGRIVWLGESKKVAGIRFLNLPESVRIRISNWISSEGSDQEFEERRAGVWENGKPLPGSSPNQDSQALRQGTHENAKNEDFWAPYPPGIPSRVLREPALAKSQTSVSLRPSAIFGPGRNKPDLLTVRSRKSGNGWKIGALLSFTAAVSLAVGICIGNGSLDPWLSKAETLMQSMRQQPGTIEPAAAYAIPEGSSSPTQSAQEQPVGSASSQSIGGPRDASSSPAPDGLPSGAAATQPRSNAANLLTLPADQAQGGVWISAPESGAPSLRLSMPAKAVSASSSLAIISRRSLVVPPISPGETSQRTERLWVGDLMSFTEPIYPAEARWGKTEDTVELRAAVSSEGKVRYVGMVSGSPLLAQAAINAISGWRYKLTLLDGQPMETEDEITMVFRLP
jgi:outer membrane biosynthesis protein TonB